jgi:hypothetical protein
MVKFGCSVENLPSMEFGLASAGFITRAANGGHSGDRVEIEDFGWSCFCSGNGEEVSDDYSCG